MESPAKPLVPLRRRSSISEAERLAVEKQVEEDLGATTTRRRSFYLPLTHQTKSERLRVTKRAIQTIYDIHQRYELRRTIENMSFAVAMLGIVILLIDNEYTDSQATKFTLRVVNAVLTVILLCLVIWRFIVEREILIKRNAVPPHISIFRMPKQLSQLVLELLVCGFLVPPGVEGTFAVWEWKFYTDMKGAADCSAPLVVDDGSCYRIYSYPYEVLGLFSLFRLYMVLRVIRNLSDFTNYRTSYLGTLHHVDTFSSLFAVKCLLRSHPFRFLIAVFVSVLVLTAYALAIVEAPVNPSLAPIWNSMWMVVLTMGTVGYGDLTSVTVPGQILLVFGGMLAGILLIGVLSAAIFGYLSLNERDKRFIQLLRRQQYNRRLKWSCAHSIQAAWKRFNALQCGIHNSNPAKYNKLSDHLYACVSNQRKTRREHPGEYRSVSTELHRCQEQLLFSLRREHVASMKRLHQVEARLDKLLSIAVKPIRTG